MFSRRWLASSGSADAQASRVSRLVRGANMKKVKERGGVTSKEIYRYLMYIVLWDTHI
jgi:hypothetical protein